MWNLQGAEGASSNPKESVAASVTRVYQTPTPCPEFGWVVALQVNQENTHVLGQVRASYTAAGTEQKTIVENFNVKGMDTFFIPYPSVQLRLTPGAAGSADCQVNFYPINDPEVAMMFNSLLYYWETTQVDGEGSEDVDPPSGATGWFPVLDNQGSFGIALKDGGGNTLLGFVLGDANAIDFPQSSGAQYFPLIEGSTLTLTNRSAEADACTVIWRYDFRKVGGA